MAAPTQEFPPWLTPVPSVFTDTNGVEMTSTSVEFLPLTYLGPSIPLGSLYTFGGSTEPATIVTGTPSETTSATPSTISTAIPTSSTSVTAIPSSTSTTLSSSSSISLSSSISSISMLSSSSMIPTSSFSTLQPSATVTQSANIGSGLSKGQLIGVIVAAILGFIFLLVFILALYLWCKGRPNRNSRTRFSMITPIDQDYFVVPAGGRTPGEGSPRHSGEEQDPFLQRSRAGRTGGAAAIGAAAGAAGEMKSVGEMGSLPPRQARVPPPPVSGTRASNSTGSSGSSGYGTVMNTRLSQFPPPPPIGDDDDLLDPNDLTNRRGRILTPEQMLRVEEEMVLPRDSVDQPRDGSKEGDEPADVHAYTALLPPPRLVDPETASYKATPSLKPYSSQQSIDTEEAATLLTARRVKVENLGPRTTPQRSPLREHLPSEMGGARNSGGILGNLGLGSLTGLGRLSWFRNMDSPRHSVHTPSFTPVPLSDNDIETGRGLLAVEKGASLGSRNFGVGLGPDGDRPVSGVSARSNASGGTVYHDAHSSIPGTPASTPGLVPPPRAHTPAEAPPLPTVHDTRWPSTTTMAPPAYDPVDATPSRQPSGANLTDDAPPAFDILDLPAPAAITNFGSASSSLRDTASGSTVGLRSNPFPPGLELLSPKAWTEMSSGVTTASPGSFSAIPAHDNEAGISIDLLEEAPPSAGDGWRAMASAAIGDHSRRTTFGMPQLVLSPHLASEQGSLHSMRSHLSSPTRSTGSAAAAVRDGSVSSGSQSRSGSSGHSLAHSLGRTGSITSDGRRRHGPISPAYSAFGPPQRGSGRHDSDILEFPPPSAHLSPDRGSTVRISGSSASDPDMSAI